MKNKQNIKEIKKIKNEIIELNDLIDKKCLEIYENNENYNNKILKNKLMMENLIIEYHKICKELLKNN